MEDHEEEKYVSKSELVPKKIEANETLVEETRSPQIKRKPPTLKIPQKSKSYSATFKSSDFKSLSKQSMDISEDRVIQEEEDEFSLQNTESKKMKSKLTRIKSDTELKKKKNGCYINLKLEISKKQKKKDKLTVYDMIGIKKEKKYYYFREELPVKFYFKEEKKILCCLDDMKFQKMKKNSDELKRKTSNDDLDFHKITVNFLQKP